MDKNPFEFEVVKKKIVGAYLYSQTIPRIRGRETLPFSLALIDEEGNEYCPIVTPFSITSALDGTVAFVFGVHFVTPKEALRMQVISNRVRNAADLEHYDVTIKENPNTEQRRPTPHGQNKNRMG